MKRRERIVLSLAIALVALMALPLTAFAAGRPAAVKPAMVVADAYENDDTTETAKALPEVSSHTLSSPDDVDWSIISADDTGTPFVLEARFAGGYQMSYIRVYSMDTSTGALGSEIANGMPLWGGTWYSSLFFVAPAPGPYYVCVSSDSPFPPTLGAYTMYEHKGIARRIAGANRYATAAEISRQMWPTTEDGIIQYLTQFSDSRFEGIGERMTPPGVIIATGKEYADALTAGAWSAQWSGWRGPVGINGQMRPLGPAPTMTSMPVLLTDPEHLSPETAAEILRLSQGRMWSRLPFTVYILGSTDSVSEAVENEVESLAAPIDGATPISDIVRIGGANRAETAAMIASYEASTEVGISDTAFLCDGFTYGDALSAGPVAGAGRAPVLLTKTTSLSPATSAWLLAHPGVTRLVVVGNSISGAIASQLATTPYSLEVTRVAGADRYETSRKLAEWGMDHYRMTPSILLVTGTNFPDGLTAAGLSAFTNGPVLLTHPESLSAQVKAFYQEYGPAELPSYVIGGTPSITSGTAGELDNLWTLLP